MLFWNFNVFVSVSTTSEKPFIAVVFVLTLRKARSYKREKEKGEKKKHTQQCMNVSSVQFILSSIHHRPSGPLLVFKSQR